MKKRLTSFIVGSGAALSIMPGTISPQERLYKPPASDSDALRGDWEKIGGDIRKSMDRVANESKK